MDLISAYVLAIIIAWVVAQGLKYLFVPARKSNQERIKKLYMSGGMPSAHSASVAALIVTIGLIDGVTTPLFGAVLLFGSIVVYDSVMVRRSSGEQGEALKLVMAKTEVKPRRQFFVAHGHTLAEAFAGLLIGGLIGALVAIFIG